MKYQLDTSILAAASKDIAGSAAIRLMETLSDCAISMIVVAEVRFGIAKKPSARAVTRSSQLVNLIPHLPWDSPADECYAALRRGLEAVGQPIGSFDMLIAAHALALDATLVTANEREFRRVPGLRVENWVA